MNKYISIIFIMWSQCLFFSCNAESDLENIDIETYVLEAKECAAKQFPGLSSQSRMTDKLRNYVMAISMNDNHSHSVQGSILSIDFRKTRDVIDDYLNYFFRKSGIILAFRAVPRWPPSSLSIEIDLSKNRNCGRVTLYEVMS